MSQTRNEDVVLEVQDTARWRLQELKMSASGEKDTYGGQ